MIQAILFIGSTMILLLVLNSFLNSICGLDSAGNHGKVIEGTLTIAFLYLVIIDFFGNHLMLDILPFGSKMGVDGIPFVDEIDNYPSLTFMFKDRPLVFVYECAELISFSFVILLISSYIPSSLGGSGITGQMIRSIILGLIGVIVNNYVISIVKETKIFSWAFDFLRCFLSGTALVITPAMIIGGLLKLDPKNEVVSFLVKKLPQTKIGKAMTTAVTDSIVLVFVIMLFESQFGSISSFASQMPSLVPLVTYLFITIIGVRLIIKSVTR